MNQEIEWKNRYYELENTIEQMLLGFLHTLDQLEEKSTEKNLPPLEIRKITRIQHQGQESLCCVADGINLEYGFEFFNEGKSVSKISLQRSNSVALPKSLIQGKSFCIVTARSNWGHKPQEISRKVSL